MTRNPVPICQTHQAAFKRDKALINRVKLLNQGINPRIIQMQRFDLINDLGLDFFIFLKLRLTHFPAREARINQHLL